MQSFGYYNDTEINRYILLEDIFGDSYEDGQENTQSGFKKIYNWFKNIIEIIKVGIIKISQSSTYNNIIDGIKFLISNLPFVNRFIKDPHFKRIDDKIRYIQNADSIDTFFGYILEFMGNIGKFILYVLNKVGIVSDKLSYNSSFINNILFNGMDNASVSVYKQIYNNFKIEGVPEKYIRQYILVLASLAPVHYILYTFSDNSILDFEKDQRTMQDQSDYYRNPLTFTGNSKRSTGLSIFHDRLLKDSAKLLEKYKNEEDPEKRNFIFIKEICKQFLRFIVWAVFLFLPIPKIYNTSSFGWFAKLIHMIILCLIITICVFHLIYANFALPSKLESNNENEEDNNEN